MTGNISFGEYSFPNNPESITVESTRQAAVSTMPAHGQRVQMISGALRKIMLEGELFAENSQDAQLLYERLAEVYSAGGARLLTVPGHTAMYAYFVKLTLKAKGDGCALAYSAAFLERESERQ